MRTAYEAGRQLWKVRFVMLLALAAAIVGVAFYGRRYVARLELDATTGEVHVHTLSLLGVRRLVVPREDLGRGSYHYGRMDGRIAVNAP